MENIKTPSGLSRAEAERARREYGENRLKWERKNSFLKQFLSAFADPIIKTLIAALILNLIIAFRSESWYEPVGIAAAVFLASFVSTLSEYGSETAFLKLQEEAENKICRVYRGGRLRRIPWGDVVRGDVIALQAGEGIPADGIIESGELFVDQSPINGESKETAKRPGEKEDRDPSSRSSLLRGCTVCSGSGIMKVTRVGRSTLFGGHAEAGGEIRESPLKTRLSELAGTISRLGYIVAFLVAAVTLFNDIAADNGFSTRLILEELKDIHRMSANILHAATLAISIVVVAVPEGLPMMITVVLSRNMLRMLKDNVMVRKLVGIETAGSLNILFSDKTGTLTCGRLRAGRLILSDGSELSGDRLGERPAVCRTVTVSGMVNTASSVIDGKAAGGNSTDRAMMDLVLPHASGEYGPAEEVLPFSSDIKFSAAKYEGMVYIKGAPEKLLPRCSSCMSPEGAEQAFSSRHILQARFKAEARKGRRIICIATAREMPHPEPRDLCFVCLAVIEDPPRPEARAVLNTLSKAGIRTVMITGDSMDTASAIASETGLNGGIMITGDRLDIMDPEEIKRILPDLSVVARALPSHKKLLVDAAQSMGLTVGMTGDGINDAPALRQADVGFSMGSGTEVAREAGDIVILDDNIASIAKAVLYGRTIYKSIQKFIMFQLTMNLCAAGVSLAAPFMGIDTPITVIQMLWINIIMDTLAGLAFAGEPTLPEYMEEPPKARTESILTSEMKTRIIFSGGFQIALCILFLTLPGVEALFRPDPGRIYFLSGFFALFIFGSIFCSFLARTPRINLLASIKGNPAFILIMTVVALVQLGLIYFGGTLFRTAALLPEELLPIIAMSAAVIPAELLRRSIKRFMIKPDQGAT